MSTVADHQIELLELGYSDLTLAQSTTDLGARIEKFFRRLFENARVSLAFRSQESAKWSPPGGTGETPHPPETLPTASTAILDPEGRFLEAIRCHSDGSAHWIAISADPTAGRLTENGLIRFRLACNVLDSAYRIIQHRRHEKGLVFSLNQRILQLSSLIDTGIEIAKLSDELPPHHMALERAAALTNAARARATVAEGESVRETFWFPAPFAVPGRDETRSISAEFEFSGITYRFELFDKESRNGIVPFDSTDTLLLNALARQVHASLENRFLLRESLEKQRIEQDLTVAASIQQKILPSTLPPIPGYDAAGINIPSKSVGGDYYDCIPLPGGRFALVIADVAGKGIPAALLVSSLHAYLNAYLEGALPLVDVTRRLNGAIHRASTDDKFITAFLGILTPETGIFEAVNAGHCTVFWRKVDGTVGELSEGGIPFGMLGIDFPYRSETVTLGPGDRLFLYTDGITEAQNDANQLYDTERSLKTFFASRTPGDARSFIAELIEDVKAFTGATPQADDMTALYLIRKAAAVSDLRSLHGTTAP